MLDLNQLKSMPPHTVFATGVAVDEPGGLHMVCTSKRLRWIAVRGDTHDWAIYCHFSSSDIDYIRNNGDKVNSEKNIRKLVPCYDEAYEMYRR